MIGFAGAHLLFHVSPTAFHVAEIPEADLLTICQTIILGILCAAVAVLFCTVIHKAVDLYKKYFPNLILRTAVGGALVLILTLLVGSQDYNGAGMDEEQVRILQSGIYEDKHTGLGLVNVHKRIRLYCGEGYGLSFESELGRGSTVSVLLPQNRPAMEMEEE